jgi:hypothetical protein
MSRSTGFGQGPSFPRTAFSSVRWRPRSLPRFAAIGGGEASPGDARHVRHLLDHRSPIGHSHAGQRFQSRQTEECGTAAPARERDAEERVPLGYSRLAQPDRLRARYTEGVSAGAPRQQERANKPECESAPIIGAWLELVDAAKIALPHLERLPTRPAFARGGGAGLWRPPPWAHRLPHPASVC